MGWWSSSRNSSKNSTTSPCRHIVRERGGENSSGGCALFQSDICTKWIRIKIWQFSFICYLSYLALLKRLQSRTEWYLPHTACNPGLCWVALMATVLVLHHNNLQKSLCHAATLWPSVILQPGKHRAHIVLQGVMWPEWGIQGFSISYTRTEPERAANNLIQTLTDFMGIMQIPFTWPKITSRLEASCDAPTQKYVNTGTHLIVAHQALSGELQHL